MGCFRWNGGEQWTLRTRIGKLKTVSRWMSGISRIRSIALRTIVGVARGSRSGMGGQHGVGLSERGNCSGVYQRGGVIRHQVFIWGSSRVVVTTKGGRV